MERLVVSRRIGMGDIVFSLAALSAARDPEQRVVFVTAPEHRELASFSCDVEAATSYDVPVDVDLDEVPTDSDAWRCALMARALGAVDDPVSVRVPWSIPKSLVKEVRDDYPNISNAVVFAPWGGGRLVTRSIPDQAIRRFLAACPYPVMLRYSSPVPGWGNVPNNICDGRSSAWLLALLSQCAAVVSVDTGVAYLSLSLGKPTVVVFTHIKPEERIGPADTAVVVRPTVDCAPCGDFAWPHAPCKGELGACALSIRADALLTALSEAMTRYGAENDR